MRHLEEHEDAVMRGKELGQDAVEEFELSGAADEMVLAGQVGVSGDGVLDLAEDEGVVADLAQLHELIVQLGRPALIRGAVFGEDNAKVLDLAVQLFADACAIAVGIENGRTHPVLQGAHLALDDALDLVRQIGLDVLLEATEQEGPQHLVQAADNEQRLLLVEIDLLLAAGIGEGRVEPLVKRFD